MTKPMEMQPESLATFAASARDRAAKKPDDVGLTATPETAPLKGDLHKEEKAAADILKEGVTGKPKGGKERAKDLPDRTRTTPSRAANSAKTRRANGGSSRADKAR